MTRLTDAQVREAEDLAKHVAARTVRVLDDAIGLCSDRRQRANIALRTLAAVFGMASVEIDRAEGRAVQGGAVSPESFDLMMSVLQGADPRALSQADRGGERG